MRLERGSSTTNAATGFSLKIMQGIGSTRVTKIIRGPSAWTEMARLQAVNYGLQHYLDAELAGEIAARLPTSVAADSQVKLLKSGLDANPYDPALATAVQAVLKTPREQVEFYHWLADRLAQMDPSGKSKIGAASLALQAGLDSQLKVLPVPTEPAERQLVQDYLSDHADKVWLKYEVADDELPGLQKRLAEALKTSVEGERDPQGCKLLAARIRLVGLAIASPEAQQAWADELLPLIEGKAKYQFHAGRKTKTLTDPSEATIHSIEKIAQRRMASQARR
jgi:hypothetical protein